MKRKNSPKRAVNKKKTFGDILMVNIPFTNFPILFVYIGLLIFFAVYPLKPQAFKLQIEYADSIEGKAVLYYNNKDNVWATDRTLKSSIDDKKVNFPITEKKAKYLRWLRLNPLEDSGELNIKAMRVYYRRFKVQQYTGKQVRSLIDSHENLKMKTEGDTLCLTLENENSELMFSSEFVKNLLIKLEDYAHILRCIYITIIMLILMTAVAFWSSITEWTGKIIQRSISEKLQISGWILYILSAIFAALSLVVYMLREFLLLNFNGLSFEEIIFHLKMPMEGTGSSMIEEFFDKWTPSIVIFLVVLVIVVVLLVLIRKVRNCRYVYRAAATASTVALVFQTILFANKLEVADYWKAQHDSSQFIEEHYVSPAKTKIAFPSQKRNLIWIYMESMESTFISKDMGGDMDENLLPEMTKLAQDNINFSESDKVGGAASSDGTSWTIAAMFAQTSGLPLLLPIDGNSYGDYSSFAPGVVSLGEILQKQGYHQELMVGSDIKFGGRKLYFQQHGDYNLYDLYTARENGKIPDDYNVWWGFEDKKLYSFAKEEIKKMAQEEEPFQFSMLTVDTHHIGGYVCDLCKDEHDDQYKNVLSCASRQVAKFVSWIPKQDFYDNTTIVISGDHPTMDNNFIEEYYDGKKPRKVYNCFVNSAIDTQYSKNREFNIFDMFPTVLASIGAEVDGEKLGLGTNLFSGEKTLAEQYGYDKIDEEFSKNSKFYKKKILKE